MNEAIKEWLVAHAEVQGLLGCGVRTPANLCVCHGHDQNCPPEKMEKMLNQIAEAQPWLFQDGALPRWMTWTFEYGQIRFVNRPDGMLLGLAVRVDTDAAQHLDQLAGEFLALPKG
jgi:hypothetical protein